MSFDFYFTGISPNSNLMKDKFLSYPNSCLLLSQLNNRKDIYKWIEIFKEIPNNQHKLFIDSGAFSAWTLGKQIDMNEYISFINEYKDFITVAASVDSIPGDAKSSRLASDDQVKESAEITWKNFLYMRSKMEDVSKLLYTYHAGEPIEYLIQALTYKDEHGFIDYIAIGGLVGKERNIIVQELNKVQDLINLHGNPNLKVHLFGMTKLDILEKYKVTSADSTTFIREAGYGNIRVNGKVIHVSDQGELKDDNFVNLSAAVREEIVKFLQNLGMTLDQVSTSSEYRILVNMNYYQTWADNYKYQPNQVKIKELW